MTQSFDDALAKVKNQYCHENYVHFDGFEDVESAKRNLFRALTKCEFIKASATLRAMSLRDMRKRK